MARALERERRLAALVTDYWARMPLKLGRGDILRRSFERWDPELDDAVVVDFPWKALAFEIGSRVRRTQGWERILERNAWFQQRASAYLRASNRTRESGSLRSVFSYSYAAAEIFRLAREQGLETVLGQIDGGPAEEDIVAAAHERHAQYGGRWQRAPREYWQRWRDEIDRSDHVVVNSAWSRQCLARAGVADDKIRVIPLAYEPAVNEPARQPRAYPREFSGSRPLRVLFLGQITIRKGIAELLEAVDLLGNAPFELILAGPIGIRVPEHFRDHPRIRWLGPVPRGRTRELYLGADVFILPTLSDGFAITQLEARARGLPLIVSRHCGEVVRPGQDGLLLEVVSATAIAAAIQSLLEDADLLAALAAFDGDAPWTVSDFGAALTALLNGHGDRGKLVPHGVPQ